MGPFLRQKEENESREEDRERKASDRNGETSDSRSSMEPLLRQKAMPGHSKLRHLQDDTPSEGSINWINYYQTVVVNAYGISYGLCLCTTSDCRKTVYDSTTATEYHFNNFVYAANDTDCNGHVITNTSLGFPKSYNVPTTCTSTGKDFNLTF